MRPECTICTHKRGKCSSHGCGPVQIQGPSSKALLMNSRLAGVGSWWCGVEMRYASACQGFPHIDPIPLRSHTTNFNFDDPLLPSLRDTFYILNCGSGAENGHETALQLVSGPNLGAFCTIFRARPVGPSLGAKFGQKPATHQIKTIICITFPKRR